MFHFFIFLIISKLELINSLSCQYLSNTLPLPIKAHSMAYSSNLNKVFLFGGLKTTTNTYTEVKSPNKIYKWDTSQPNEWFTQIATTVPGGELFSHFSNVATIGDKVYFVGMQKLVSTFIVDHDHYHEQFTLPASTELYIFDMAAETFSTGTTAPINTAGGCVAADDSHIFMIGGTSNFGSEFSSYTQIYDINTNSWTTEQITEQIAGASVEIHWGYQFCEMVGSSIYVFGGYIDYPNNPVDKIYEYAWNNALSQGQWTSLGTKSVASTAGSTSYNSNDGNIYIVGGGGDYWFYNENDSYYYFYAPYSDTIDVFNTNSKTITNTFRMNKALSALDTLIMNDILYIYGGWDNPSPEVHSDKVEVCHLIPLIIRTCAGSSSTSYKAQIIGIQSDFDIRHVKMRDARSGNIWLNAYDNYDTSTKCYEWLSSNTVAKQSFKLPLDFKLKANKDGTGVVIRAWGIINDFNEGTEGDMGRNFIVGTEEDDVNTQTATFVVDEFGEGTTAFYMFIVAISVIVVVLLLLIGFIVYRCTAKKKLQNIVQGIVQQNSPDPPQITNAGSHANDQSQEMIVDEITCDIEL